MWIDPNVWPQSPEGRWMALALVFAIIAFALAFARTNAAFWLFAIACVGSLAMVALSVVGCLSD